MTRKERYGRVLGYFREQMPVAETELEYGNTFQLLVAVMLSAQCTDKRVNQVTPGLFARFPDAAAMSAATVDDLLALMGSVSYPNAKARHLIETARLLQQHYGGEVPGDFDALTALPGVGRKTANVVRAVAFGGTAMPVDTHVFRVSHRLGLVPSKADTPYKVEVELMRNIPADDISNAHHWLLLHGRYVCQSRRPRCGDCPFDGFCPKGNAPGKA
mgnify:CR=1 FL=1